MTDPSKSIGVAALVTLVSGAMAYAIYRVSSRLLHPIHALLLLIHEIYLFGVNLEG